METKKKRTPLIISIPNMPSEITYVQTRTVRFFRSKYLSFQFRHRPHSFELTKKKKKKEDYKNRSKYIDNVVFVSYISRFKFSFSLIN